MNDRFRFRVWNIQNEEMIYNAEIAYDGMNYNTSWQIGNNTNDGWVDCFGYYLDYPENYKIMQSPGLKDKNGKLIYELDVVNGSCGVYWGKMIVEYNVAGFVLNKNGKYLNFLEGENYIEVIGNIYENKDLLNA